MNQKVVASSERVVRVFRGERELVSGDTYNFYEMLTVRIRSDRIISTDLHRNCFDIASVQLRHKMAL